MSGMSTRQFLRQLFKFMPSIRIYHEYKTFGVDGVRYNKGVFVLTTKELEVNNENQ